MKGDVLNEEMNEVKQEEQKETEKENITNLEQSGKK